MAFSVGLASLACRLLYGADVVVKGRVMHALGMRVMAVNLSGRPNAVLVPIPAVGLPQVLDASAIPTLLEDLERSSFPGSASAPGVAGKGAFHVAIAADGTAAAVAAALRTVPEHVRPLVPESVRAAFVGLYPGHALALACFHEDVADDVPPLLFAYAPQDRTHLFLPGLRGGEAALPNLSSVVDAHDVLLLSSNFALPGGNVHLRGVLPDSLRPYVLPASCGATRSIARPTATTWPPPATCGRARRGPARRARQRAAPRRSRRPQERRAAAPARPLRRRTLVRDPQGGALPMDRSPLASAPASVPRLHVARGLAVTLQSAAIGRESGNQVCILDGRVSKKHCVIERRESGLVLRDLSMNARGSTACASRGKRRSRDGGIIRMTPWSSNSTRGRAAACLPWAGEVAASDET